jgi:hypothetical protein
MLVYGYRMIQYMRDTLSGLSDVDEVDEVDEVTSC